jgi:hypothetical protein
MSVRRWLGKKFVLRDGDNVTIIGVTMPLPGLLNFALSHSGLYPLEPGVHTRGPLYLTENELANNVRP